MLDHVTGVFREVLSPQERILWAGQPRQGLLLRLSDAWMIPFSLVWGGFAVFMALAAIGRSAPFIVKLVNLPLVVAGVYLVIGRFFVDAKLRETTYYALTNERVVVLSGLFRRNIRSLSLKGLSDMNLSAQGNGRGTITFGPSHPMAAWFAITNMPWPGMGTYMPATFEMIDNARQVYELLRQAQREQ